MELGRLRLGTELQQGLPCIAEQHAGLRIEEAVIFHAGEALSRAAFCREDALDMVKGAADQLDERRVRDAEILRQKVIGSFSLRPVTRVGALRNHVTSA
jgi:hypothetical protein